MTDTYYKVLNTDGTAFHGGWQTNRLVAYLNGEVA